MKNQNPDYRKRTHYRGEREFADNFGSLHDLKDFLVEQSLRTHGMQEAKAMLEKFIKH